MSLNLSFLTIKRCNDTSLIELLLGWNEIAQGSSDQHLYQAQNKWRLSLFPLQLPLHHRQQLRSGRRSVLGLRHPGLLVQSPGVEVSALSLLSTWHWSLRTQTSTVSLSPGADDLQPLLLTTLLRCWYTCLKLARVVCACMCTCFCMCVCVSEYVCCPCVWTSIFSFLCVLSLWGRPQKEIKTCPLAVSLWLTNRDQRKIGQMKKVWRHKYSTETSWRRWGEN